MFAIFFSYLEKIYLLVLPYHLNGNGKNKTNPLRKLKFHFDDTSTKINDEEFKHIEKIQKEITDLEVPAFIRRQQQ